MDDMKCLECGGVISCQVNDYSLNKYGIPLFMPHQKWIHTHPGADYAIRLYFELKWRGVAAQLEKFDGTKHIDIVIPKAKVNIEVDRGQHNYSARQVLSDLKRTDFSFLYGWQHTTYSSRN